MGLFIYGIYSLQKLLFLWEKKVFFRIRFYLFYYLLQIFTTFSSCFFSPTTSFHHHFHYYFITFTTSFSLLILPMRFHYFHFLILIQGEGHLGAVNDVAFHHQGGSAGITLFSCGADGQVIQWDLRNKNVALYVLMKGR